MTVTTVQAGWGPITWAAPSAASSKWGETTTMRSSAPSSSAPHIRRGSMRGSVTETGGSAQGPPVESDHADDHQHDQISHAHHEAHPRLDMGDVGDHEAPQPLTDVGHGVEGAHHLEPAQVSEGGPGILAAP